MCLVFDAPKTMGNVGCSFQIFPHFSAATTKIVSVVPPTKQEGEWQTKLVNLLTISLSSFDRFDNPTIWC